MIKNINFFDEQKKLIAIQSKLSQEINKLKYELNEKENEKKEIDRKLSSIAIAITYIKGESDVNT